MFKKLNMVLIILLFMSVLSMIAIGSPQPIGPYYDDSVFVYGDDGLSLNIGISDGYILKVDDADAAVDDYCKLTANGIVGRNYSEVKTDLGIDLTLYYLKTEIDTQGKVETIWGVTLATDAELATLKFTDLTDTPANYTGSANKFLQVNATPDALIFDTISSDDLSDVASIAMLDENEIVSGQWTFTDYIDLIKETDTPTSSPFWEIIRKRDGDPTYNVSDGDRLGFIDFTGWYADYSEAVRIMADVDGVPVDYLVPGKLKIYTRPASGSLTLRTEIDSAGNIKMGDGAWTNYINISNLGVLTLEGTANIEGVDATELSYLDGVTSDIQTQLDAKKGKNYYSALGSDHTYSDNADTDTQPVGESVVFGDLLYFDWADKEWKKARANVYATTPAERIALESKNDGEDCLMLVKGYIRDESAFDFGASRIFLNDDVAGTCDDTAPAESGDQIQIVGTAIHADILFFNPSVDVGEI